MTGSRSRSILGSLHNHELCDNLQRSSRFNKISCILALYHYTSFARVSCIQSKIRIESIWGLYFQVKGFRGSTIAVASVDQEATSATHIVAWRRIQICEYEMTETSLFIWVLYSSGYHKPMTYRSSRAYPWMYTYFLECKIPEEVDQHSLGIGTRGYRDKSPAVHSSNLSYQCTNHRTLFRKNDDRTVSKCTGLLRKRQFSSFN